MHDCVLTAAAFGTQTRVSVIASDSFSSLSLDKTRDLTFGSFFSHVTNLLMTFHEQSQ